MVHSAARYGFLFLLGLGVSMPANAARVVALSLDELVDAAEVIVVGNVASAVAERPRHAPKRIRTQVVVKVDEFLKRDAGTQDAATVTLFVPGGEVGRFGQKVPGAPSLKVGERVLLHLRRDVRGELQVVGLSQGVHHIELLQSVPQAVRHNEGVDFVVRDAQGRLVKTVHRPHVEREPLAPLLTRIRSRVARGTR